MPRRTPQDVWNALVAEAGEDEIERAASVSVRKSEPRPPGAVIAAELRSVAWGLFFSG
jgi:hypothetical protein